MRMVADHAHKPRILSHHVPYNLNCIYIYHPMYFIFYIYHPTYICTHKPLVSSLCLRLSQYNIICVCVRPRDVIRRRSPEFSVLQRTL